MPSASTLRAARPVGDMTWRVRLRSGRLDDGTLLYLVLPTEFQSVPDMRMGLRLSEYAGLLLDALVPSGTVARADSLPQCGGSRLSLRWAAVSLLLVRLGLEECSSWMH